MSTTAAAPAPDATADGLPIANGGGGGGGPPPLSKSQKKRMKQKASKAKKAEAEAAAVMASGSGQTNGTTGTGTSISSIRPNTAALNPVDRLRADVTSRCGGTYGPDQVDAAISEMFEAGMQYDVADDVVAYLERKAAGGGIGGGGGGGGDEMADEYEGESGGGGIKAAPSRDSVHTEATSASTRIESPVSSYGTTATTGAAAPAAAAATATAQQPGQQQRQQVAIEEAAEETKSDAGDDDEVEVGEAEHQHEQQHEQQQVQQQQQPASSSSRRRKNKPPPQQPMDLMAKLEVVSDSENLGDAIFALTEWITKAAKPSEISDLCNPNKSRALPTVLRRSIVDTTTDDNSDSAILKLIRSILLTSGCSDADSVCASLGSTIAKARSDLVGSTADAAKVVTDRIIAALSRTLDQIKVAVLANDSARSIRLIEEEIDALASNLPTSASGGILGLMTRRDCHKVAAEKSSSVVGIAVVSAAKLAGGGPTSAPPADIAAAAGGGSDNEDRGKIVSALLGDSYGTVSAGLAEYETLRADLDAARSSSSSERAALSSERDAHRTEREEISVRLDAIRREMDMLQRKDVELDGKVTAVEAKLDDLDSELDDGVKDIKAKLSARAGDVKLDEAARGVADCIVELEGAMSAAAMAMAASVAQPSPGGEAFGSKAGDGGSGAMTPDKVSNKMGIYFVRMRNYFKAEADCVEFMVNRAASLESGLGDLEREIQECKALGMTTNVSQMTQSLKETKRNIAEDRGVVAALRGEAEKMRDDFMARLDEYKSTCGDKAETNQALTSLQLSVLSGIRDAMSRIGMNDAGLTEYIDSVAADASAPLHDASLSESQIMEHFGDDDDAKDDAEDGAEGGAEEDGDVDGGVAAAVGGDVLPLQLSDVDNAAADAQPTDPAKAAAPTQTKPAAAMPKLSWAVSAAPKKAGGKSLLEIQKEELSAKVAES